MNYRIFTVIGFWVLFLGAFTACAFSQKLLIAKTFDANGALIGPDSVFDFQAPHLYVAVKLKMGSAIGADELFVVVKDLDGTHGRFLMKRSARNATEANALIRLEKEGIYRVMVYDPTNRSRPVAAGRVFVTGAFNGNREALITAQRNLLIQRGQLQASASRPAPAGTITRPTNNPAQASATRPPSAATATAPATAARPGSATPGLNNAADDFSVDAGELEDELGSLEEEDSPPDPDLNSMDTDVDGMDDDINSLDGSIGDDLGGEFESYDELDEDFDFDINDF